MNSGYIADQLIYFYSEISGSDLKVLRVRFVYTGV